MLLILAATLTALWALVVAVVVAVCLTAGREDRRLGALLVPGRDPTGGMPLAG